MFPITGGKIDFIAYNAKANLSFTMILELPGSHVTMNLTDIPDSPSTPDTPDIPSTSTLTTPSTSTLTTPDTTHIPFLDSFYISSPGEFSTLGIDFRFLGDLISSGTNTTLSLEYKSKNGNSLIECIDISLVNY